MEDTSFLFAGLKFDRKKFPKDFQLFKAKREDNDSEAIARSVEIAGTEPAVNRTSKKRKWKGASAVEGFNVFKSADTILEVDENAKAMDESSDKRKEVFRANNFCVKSIIFIYLEAMLHLLFKASRT